MMKEYPTKEEVLELVPQICFAERDKKNRYYISLILNGENSVDYVIPYDYLMDDKILFAIAKSKPLILECMNKEYLQDFKNVEKLFNVSKYTFALFDFDHMGLNKIPGAEDKICELINRDPSIILDIISYHDVYCKNSKSNTILSNPKFMQTAARRFVQNDVLIPYMKMLDENPGMSVYFEKAFGDVLSDPKFEAEIMDYVVNKNDGLKADKERVKHLVDFKAMVTRAKVRAARDSFISDEKGRPVEYDDFETGEAFDLGKLNPEDKNYRGTLH